MTIQQIQFFLTVANCGNFTKAAEILFSSQPTISRQILMLEEELGYQLFLRNKKPIRLTASGKILYDGLKKSMQQIDYCKEMARAASQGKIGTLSLGFLSGFFPEYAFFPLIEELKETCPDLRIQCTKGTAQELIQGLQDESLDLAVVFEHQSFAHSGLTIHRLQTTDAYLLMSAHHPLAQKKELDYEDLNNTTFYLPAPEDVFQLENLLEPKYRTDLIHKVEVASAEVAYMKVLLEDGLTITNPYDPILKDNQLFYARLLEPERIRPCICAVTNPFTQNAVKDLFLNLMCNIEF